MTGENQKPEVKGATLHQEFAVPDEAVTKTVQFDMMGDDELQGSGLKHMKDERVVMTDEQVSSSANLIHVEYRLDVSCLSNSESPSPQENRPKYSANSCMVSRHTSMQASSPAKSSHNRVYFLQILDKSCVGYAATFGLREDAVSMRSAQTCRNEISYP